MKNIIKIAVGIIIAVILSYNHHIIYIPNTEFCVKYNIQYYIDIISSILLIIFSAFLFLKVKNKKITKLEIFYLILLDITLLISNSFITTGDLSFIYKEIKNVLYNIIIFVLNYILLKKILLFIKDYIKNHEYKIKENKIIKIFEKHPFLFSLIAILMFWLVYIIAYYPVILSPDPSYQILQYFNVYNKYAEYVILLDENIFLTNHHPVFHTFILGTCLQIGRLLLNDNFGLFIFSFIQIFLLAITLSYTIKYLKENNINIKICLIILSIYCLVPMFPFYAMSAVKDTLYTILIIWYVLKLDEIIRKKDLNSSNLIALLFISIFVCLLRNNGVYVILLSFPLLMIYLKKYWKQILIVFIGVISFYATFTKVLLPAFKITGGSIRETLSIPFQQTARYVTYYDNEISNEDKDVIRKIIGYESLAKRYDPEKSDPVKNGYNKYATKKDLIAYFKVWLKGLINRPLVYIEATIHNIYGYFSPQKTNWYLYFDYNNTITRDGLLDYHYNNFENLRSYLAMFGQAFPYIPLVGLISNIGFNTWLLLGLSFYSIIKKKKEFLIVLSPLLVSLLICVASPVNTYFRYAMPYIFIMPCLFSLIIHRFKNNKD